MYLLSIYTHLSGTNRRQKWNIGLHGGITQYAGDMGSDLYKFDQAWVAPKPPDLKVSKDAPIPMAMALPI